MLFNSYSFLFVFLPLTLAAYWSIRGTTARKLVCFLASYVFYGMWSVKFALLMLGTTSVDFFTARAIEDSESRARKRGWLFVSLFANLGVLAVFKYYDFFAGSLNELLPRPLLPLLHVALPIGISFYTFESMSYTIDVYRGDVRALRSFLDYGHFVTMFPRLVAGPIVRYTDLADQLRKLPVRLESERVLKAGLFFALGLAKKVLLADPIASALVDPAFAQPGGLGLIGAWIAALAYTMQLYFDFSGYSDMAVALGHLLGLELPRNFALPYASQNISEFWRRWHISLSTWLRDYLYIPLGGNRGEKAFVARNLMLTMLLGGLWHGANWTFIVWGALHGGALVLYNLKIVRAGWMPKPLAVAVTFVFVVVAWVMFRADTVGHGMEVLSAMAGARGLGAAGAVPKSALLRLLLAGGLAFTFDTYDVPLPRKQVWALAVAALLVACILRLGVPSPFLYFQF